MLVFTFMLKIFLYVLNVFHVRFLFFLFCLVFVLFFLVQSPEIVIFSLFFENDSFYDFNLLRVYFVDKLFGSVIFFFLFLVFIKWLYWLLCFVNFFRLLSSRSISCLLGSVLNFSEKLHTFLMLLLLLLELPYRIKFPILHRG